MTDHDRTVWPLGRVAGLVTFGGVAAWAAAVAVLGTDRPGFNSLVRLSGNVVFRVAASVVVAAALLHLVDGLGRCLATERPDRWRAAAWFFALALGLPAAAMLLWPFVEGRIS
jgi:hypothetical protein